MSPHFQQAVWDKPSRVASQLITSDTAVPTQMVILPMQRTQDPLSAMATREGVFWISWTVTMLWVESWFDCGALCGVVEPNKIWATHFSASRNIRSLNFHKKACYTFLFFFLSAMPEFPRMCTSPAVTSSLWSLSTSCLRGLKFHSS